MASSLFISGTWFASEQAHFKYIISILFLYIQKEKLSLNAVSILFLKRLQQKLQHNLRGKQASSLKQE